MKTTDYYSILGVDRNVDNDEIKKAFRKLAHLYHPDVSKDPDCEEKFKRVSEAYLTLKCPIKRNAYNRCAPAYRRPQSNNRSIIDDYGWWNSLFWKFWGWDYIWSDAEN